MSIRVRFAPSPTGFLHVGNARVALFNYLFARHNDGKFILRIEDTDIERHNEKAVDVIFRALKWMGLNWDEGPDVGGDFGPYRQSQRFDIYKRYAKTLLEKGLAYECFCTPEELESMRNEQIRKGEPPRYTGKCRSLTNEQKQKFLSEGRKPVLRFKVPEKTVIWNDLVKGRMVIDSNQLGGDFVIVRSNGIPMYNFAVVVDDTLMKISHVIRGEDHLSNTPKQILLYEAFGFQIPEFAHLPMILGSDKTKLSKRHGSTSVSDFERKGYLPEAFVNFLSLLGWYPEDGKEILSMNELIERFDLKDVNSSPAIFDVKKLNWMNEVYIRKYPIPKLTDLIVPYLKEANLDTSKFDRHWLEKAVAVTRDYMTVLSDAPKYMSELMTDEITISDDAMDFLNPSRVEVIESFYERVKSMNALDSQSFKSALRSIGKELKVRGKELYMPIRIGITGKTKGIELDKLVDLLGKKRIEERLSRTLSAVKKAL